MVKNKSRLPASVRIAFVVFVALGIIIIGFIWMSLNEWKDKNAELSSAVDAYAEMVESKQERLDELMTLQSEISLDFNQSRVGTMEKVIVDDFVDGVLVCRSEFESPEVDGEILVRHDSSVMGDLDPYSLIGEFIKVRVIGADEYDLIAEPLEV